MQVKFCTLLKFAFSRLLCFTKILYHMLDHTDSAELTAEIKYRFFSSSWLSLIQSFSKKMISLLVEILFHSSFLQGIMSSQLSSLLFLVVGISMAITPWLAAGGQLIASRFEQHDVRSLLPAESEVKFLYENSLLLVGKIVSFSS